MALYGLPSVNSRFVPMKYILILYMCSINTGKCPSNSISGYQFDTYYDCVNSGYAIAQQTFRTLPTLEEYDIEIINKNKLPFAEGNAIKYICRHSAKGGVEDM